MEHKWFESLEAHIKDQISQIDQLTPSRERGHEASLLFESQLESSSLHLKKLLSDKEREIGYLRKELQSYVAVKEQCSNLEKQLKFMRDKLLHYESELNSKSLALTQLEHDYSGLQDSVFADSEKSSSLQEELAKSKHALEEIKQATAALQMQHANLNQLYKESEENRDLLSEKIKDIEKELKAKRREASKWEQSTAEKDQIAFALEEDNEKLRSELEKAMDSLQKCQIELGFIPKIRKELMQAEQYASAMAKENEKEKKLREQLQADKENSDDFLKKLVKLTNGDDPLLFIEELTEKLSRSNFEIANINEQLISIEDKQKQHDLEHTSALEGVGKYLKTISDFISDGFFTQQIPTYPRMEHILDETCYHFYTVLSKTHKDILLRTDDLQRTNAELMKKTNNYEEILLKSNEKQEVFNRQIEQQESLYYQLNSDRQKIEKELAQKTDELEILSGFKNHVNKIIGPYSNKYHTDALNTLKEMRNHLEKYTKLYSETSQECQKIKDDLKKSEENREKDRDQYDKHSRQYCSRIECLSEEIEKLKTEILRYEKNLTEVLEKHKMLTNKYISLEREYEKLKQTNQSLAAKLTGGNAYLDEVLQEIFPYVVRWKELVQEKQIWKHMLKANEEIVSSMASSFSTYIQSLRPRKPYFLFRKCVICIIALNRLKKPYRFTTKHNKVFLKKPLSISSGEILARLLNKYSPSFNHLSMIRKLHQGLLRSKSTYPVQAELPIKLLNFFQDQLSTQALTIHDSQQQLIEINRLKESFEQALEVSEKEKEELMTQAIEMRQQLTATTNQLIASASSLKTQDQELNKHKTLCVELQESVTQLQECVEIVNSQRVGLEYELEQTNKQNECMSGIIDNLKNCLAKAGKGTLEFEVANLSEILKKFMLGYTTLETKLEQNAKYVEGLIEELKKKNKIIRILREEKEPLNSTSSFIPLS